MKCFNIPFTCLLGILTLWEGVKNPVKSLTLWQSRGGGHPGPNSSKRKTPFHGPHRTILLHPKHVLHLELNTVSLLVGQVMFSLSLYLIAFKVSCKCICICQCLFIGHVSHHIDQMSQRS